MAHVHLYGSPNMLFLNNGHEIDISNEILRLFTE